LDVFKLFGTIAINNAGANKAISETSGLAEGLSKTFSKVGSAVMKVGAVAGAGFTAAAAGASMLMKKSVQSYSEYEQLEGGVKKLFGDSADAMMANAQKAYKTAGMSANQYMSQATSFASALIKSVGGDTEKAVGLADMAMRDMADNANTYGTDMQLIQNAYQGFSKQNYTMLDNLKLGYGGTRSEMQRLLKDAQKIQKQNGVNVKYNIKNLDDIYEAIHVIQEANGVAGTTAAEAAETIAGSWASAGAAWENMLVGMADGTQDMDFLIDNFATSATNVITNVAKILPNIAKGLSKVIEGLIPELPGMVETLLPSVIEGAVSVVSGLVSIMPKLLSTLGKTLADTWKFKVWRGIQKFFKINFGISLPSWGMVVHELKEWCNTVLNEAGTAIDTVRSKFETATTFLSETFAPVFEKIAPIIASAKEALQPLGEKFAEVKDKIATFIGKAVEYVENGSATKDATDLLKSAFQWLANAIISVVDGVGKFATWCKENQTTITVLSVILGSFALSWTLVNGAVKLWGVISAAAATGTGLLSAAIGALTSPVTLTILAIGALIAAVALCIIYWDKITASIDSAALELAEFFGIDVPEDWSLCQDIAAGFEWLAGKISAVIGMVQDLLRWLGILEEKNVPGNQPQTVNQARESGMSQHQINMGLANGTITGVPKATEYEWDDGRRGASAAFAKGGVFSKPTFFDTRLGKTLVGEAGAEAVAPIDVLQGYVAAAVASQNAGIASALERVVEAIESMDANMGGHMRDALEDTSLKVNNREFARMVKAVG
jgi:phage-related protein